MDDPPRPPDRGVARLARRLAGREEDRKTAFYFSQPPPLAPVPGSASLEPRGPLGRSHGRRPTKRQVARMNLGYLRSTSVAHRNTVRAWARAVEERTARAGARRARTRRGRRRTSGRGTRGTRSSRRAGRTACRRRPSRHRRLGGSGPALAHDDRAGGDRLPAERLHPEPLRGGIPPVPGRAAALLVRHGVEATATQRAPKHRPRSSSSCSRARASFTSVTSRTVRSCRCPAFLA